MLEKLKFWQKQVTTEQKDENSQEESFINILSILASFVITTFFVYTCLLLTAIWPIDSKTIAQAGAFGDSFGVLTSLFSCLTLVCLLITLKQQRDANKQQQEANALQRKELEATRLEMMRTADAQAEQSTTLKLQQFENTFFQTLSLLQKTIESIEFNDLNGRDATDEIFNVFSTHISTWEGTDHQAADDFFNSFHHIFCKIINPTNTVLLTLKHSHSEIDRNFYMHILCTCLTSQELMLINYWVKYAYPETKEAENIQLLFQQMNFVQFIENLNILT